MAEKAEAIKDTGKSSVNRKKELFSNTIIVGIGNFINSGISFLLVPLLTAWLTPNQYGNYDLLYSYVSLLSPFITLQLDQAVLRFTLENSEKGKDYFQTCLMLVLINSGIALLLFGSLCTFRFHLAFVFCTITYAFKTYCIEYLRGKNQLKQYSIANICDGTFTLIGMLFLVRIFKTGVSGVLFSYAISSLSLSLFIFTHEKLYKHFSFHLSLEDKETIKKFLLYSLPLLPNSISWWITNVSDRTLIRIFLGSYYNGIYAVSCKIPTLITVFYGTFNLAWQQSAILSAKDNEEKRREFYNSVFRQLTLFLFSSAFVIIASTPILYRLFLNVRYQEGMVLVPILILSTTVLNLGQYLGGILIGMKNTKANGAATVVAAVVNILIDLIFIQKIGLYAAAISTLIGYCFMLWLRLRSLGDLFQKKKIAKITMYGGCLVLVESFVVLHTANVFLQWLWFGMTCLVFVLMNKKILLVIKEKFRQATAA